MNHIDPVQAVAALGLVVALVGLLWALIDMLPDNNGEDIY